MRILIGGDFYVSEEYFDKELINNNIIELFKNSEFNILNLETPIGLNFKTNLNKLLKVGPHLITGVKIFSFLKKLNINLVTLANNHIMDYGVEAFNNTLDLCRINNISYVGVGKDLSSASEPVILEKKGIKICVVNFCENEWSIAGNDLPGANPLDVISIFDQIQHGKKFSDCVIVIAHVGNEYYNLPSPRILKLFRFLAKNGADLIVSHHTHTCSGYEYVEGVPVFYGIGNFLFTKRSPFDEWYNGRVLELNIQRGKPIKTKLHYIAQDKKSFYLSLVKGEKKESSIRLTNRLSSIIQNELELKNQWEIYLNKRSKSVNILSPINHLPTKLLRGVLKMFGFNALILNKNYLVKILNVIRCESHYEVILYLLKQGISKKNKT